VACVLVLGACLDCDIHAAAGPAQQPDLDTHGAMAEVDPESQEDSDNLWVESEKGPAYHWETPDILAVVSACDLEWLSVRFDSPEAEFEHGQVWQSEVLDIHAADFEHGRLQTVVDILAGVFVFVLVRVVEMQPAQELAVEQELQ
jgi:hypothetical protein